MRPVAMDRVIARYQMHLTHRRIVGRGANSMYHPHVSRFHSHLGNEAERTRAIARLHEEQAARREQTIAAIRVYEQSRDDAATDEERRVYERVIATLTERLSD
jgi:hypothetical protein